MSSTAGTIGRPASSFPSSLCSIVHGSSFLIRLLPLRRFRPAEAAALDERLPATPARAAASADIGSGSSHPRPPPLAASKSASRASNCRVACPKIQAAVRPAGVLRSKWIGWSLVASERESAGTLVARVEPKRADRRRSKTSPSPPARSSTCSGPDGGPCSASRAPPSEASACDGLLPRRIPQLISHLALEQHEHRRPAGEEDSRLRFALQHVAQYRQRHRQRHQRLAKPRP